MLPYSSRLTKARPFIVLCSCCQLLRVLLNILSPLSIGTAILLHCLPNDMENLMLETYTASGVGLCKVLPFCLERFFATSLRNCLLTWGKLFMKLAHVMEDFVVVSAKYCVLDLCCGSFAGRSVEANFCPRQHGP